MDSINYCWITYFSKVGVYFWINVMVTLPEINIAPPGSHPKRKPSIFGCENDDFREGSMDNTKLGVTSWWFTVPPWFTALLFLENMAFGAGLYLKFHGVYSNGFPTYSIYVMYIVSTPECAIKNQTTTCAVEAPTETKKWVPKWSHLPKDLGDTKKQLWQ